MKSFILGWKFSYWPEPKLGEATAHWSFDESRRTRGEKKAANGKMRAPRLRYALED